MRYGNSTTPEAELWQAVVLRAMMDALAPGRDGIDKSRADTWFRKGDKQFREVCSLAGFDPDFIRDSYLSGRVNYDSLANKFTDKFFKVAA
jgi:hypothetical protein